MTEDEAEVALVTGARAGATPVDVCGTAWGQALAGIDPETLAVSGRATIEIPARRPSTGTSAATPSGARSAWLVGEPLRPRGRFGRPALSRGMPGGQLGGGASAHSASE